MDLITQILNGVSLLAPESFWKATEEERHRVCNGCGSKGFGWLIPDWFLGINFEPACNIHDWMYSESKTELDKSEADIVFLNNMMRLVDAAGGLFRWARVQRAWTYYHAVRDFD